jgi:hypothetical protein
MKTPIEAVNNSKAFKAKLKELVAFDKKIGRKEDTKERADIVLELLKLHDEEVMMDAFIFGYKEGYKACEKISKSKMPTIVQWAKSKIGKKK